MASFNLSHLLKGSVPKCSHIGVWPRAPMEQPGLQQVMRRPTGLSAPSHSGWPSAPSTACFSQAPHTLRMLPCLLRPAPHDSRPPHGELRYLHLCRKPLTPLVGKGHLDFPLACNITC